MRDFASPFVRKLGSDLATSLCCLLPSLWLPQNPQDGLETQKVLQTGSSLYQFGAGVRECVEISEWGSAAFAVCARVRVQDGGSCEAGV